MKGKPIQIQVTGLENNSSTQTSYVITMLTDAWEIFQKTSLNPNDKWIEVNYGDIEYINKGKEYKEEEFIEEIKSKKCYFCWNEFIWDWNYCSTDCEVADIPF